MLTFYVTKAQWSKPGDKHLHNPISLFRDFMQMSVGFLTTIQFRILHFVLLSCLPTLLKFGVIPQSFMAFSVFEAYWPVIL